MNAADFAPAEEGVQGNEVEVMLHEYIVFFPSAKRPSQCEPGTLICLPRVVAGLLMIGK